MSRCAAETCVLNQATESWILSDTISSCVTLSARLTKISDDALPTDGSVEPGTSTMSLECTFVTQLEVQEIKSGKISVFSRILTLIKPITSLRYSLIPGIQSSPCWWIMRGLTKAQTFRTSSKKSRLTWMFLLNRFRVYTIACMVNMHLKTLKTGKWRRLSIFLTSRAQMLQTSNLLRAKNFFSVKKTA